MAGSHRLKEIGKTTILGVEMRLTPPVMLAIGLLLGGMCGSGAVHYLSSSERVEMENELGALQVEYEGVLQEYVKLSLRHNYLSARAIEQEFLLKNYNELNENHNLLLRMYDDLMENHTGLLDKYEVLYNVCKEILGYLKEKGEWDYLDGLIDAFDYLNTTPPCRAG